MSKKIYIISYQDEDFSWSSSMKIVAATTSRKKAQDKLDELILKPWTYYDEYEECMVNVKKYELDNGNIEYRPTKKSIKSFITDMTSGIQENIEKHCCDEFPFIKIWCDVIEEL